METWFRFRLGAHWLAFSVGHVEEVCSPSPPTPIPLAPRHIIGLTTIRGRVIPLLDLRLFLDLPEAGGARAGEDPDRPMERVIIVAADGMQVGIPCDQTAGLVQVGEARRLDAVQGEKLKRYARAEIMLDQDLLVLVDVPTLLEGAKVRP